MVLRLIEFSTGAVLSLISSLNLRRAHGHLGFREGVVDGRQPTPHRGRLARKKDDQLGHDFACLVEKFGHA
jgi:hypothetical protein